MFGFYNIIKSKSLTQTSKIGLYKTVIIPPAHVWVRDVDDHKNNGNAEIFCVRFSDPIMTRIRTNTDGKQMPKSNKN